MFIKCFCCPPRDVVASDQFADTCLFLKRLSGHSNKVGCPLDLDSPQWCVDAWQISSKNLLKASVKDFEINPNI